MSAFFGSASMALVNSAIAASYFPARTSCYPLFRMLASLPNLRLFFLLRKPGNALRERKKRY